MRKILIITRCPSRIRYVTFQTLTPDLSVHVVSIDEPPSVRDLRGITVVAALLDGVSEVELAERLPEHYVAIRRAMESTATRLQQLHEPNTHAVTND